MSEFFAVESPPDILAAIPPAVFTDDLSASGRLVLLLAFTLPERPSKPRLMQLAGIGSDTTWKKVARELEVKGWLVRRNHGGGGRGIFRHERIFMRTPIPDPLLCGVMPQEACG